MITELGAARSLRGSWRSLSSPPTSVLASQHSSASRVISFGFIYPAKARSSLTLLSRGQDAVLLRLRSTMADSPTLNVLLMFSAKRRDRKNCPPSCAFPWFFTLRPYTWHTRICTELCGLSFVITRCYIVRALPRSRAERNDLRALFVSRGNLYTPYTLRGPENPHVSRPVPLHHPPSLFSLLEWHAGGRGGARGGETPPESEIHSRAFRIISRSAMLFSAHIPPCRAI